MINKYNESFLSKYVDYNDQSACEYADNVFEKLRQSGILANYVERDKSTRTKVNSSKADTLIDDLLFTFGKCFNSNRIRLSSLVNIGTVWQLSFEVKASGGSSICEILYSCGFSIQNDDDFIYTGSGACNVLSLAASFTENSVLKIKAIRNHKNIDIYINGVYFNNFSLSLDLDTTFNYLFICNINPYYAIGNIQILQNDKVLYWWKLNYTYGSQNLHLDTIDGDIDFYSYFYPLCYMFGLVNTYKQQFDNSNSTDLILQRILESKGIAYKTSQTLAELQDIYDNWVQEIKYRGTDKIKRQINTVKGVGINGQLMSISIDVDSVVDCLTEHTLEFDIYCKSGIAPVQSEVYFQAGANSIDTVSDKLSYSTTSETISVDFIKEDDTFYHIKIIRNNLNVLFYVNDVFLGLEVLTSNDDYSFACLASGNFPSVANFKVKTPTFYYEWKCNENNGFILNSNQLLTTYNAIINGVLYDDVYDHIWHELDAFNNIEYSEIEGELRRLINYDYEEFIFEFVKNSELGLCIDNSSWLSQEPSFINVNKAYEKGTVKDRSKYPAFVSNGSVYVYNTENSLRLHIGASGHIGGINNPLISNGIYSANAYYKPNGLIEFIPIPVVSSTKAYFEYEISFKFKIDKSCTLYFGVECYDKDLVWIPNATHFIVSNNASSALNYFLGATPIDLLDTYIWVRGILTNNVSIPSSYNISDTTNLGIGVNLTYYDQPTVANIIPTISFMNLSVTDEVNVDIKDLVIRPTTLPIEKGFINNKNTIISYLDNQSGQNQIDIDKFIKDKLIPYNCNLIKKDL
jgi:hypothetical protein